MSLIENRQSKSTGWLVISLVIRTAIWLIGAIIIIAGAVSEGDAQAVMLGVGLFICGIAGIAAARGIFARAKETANNSTADYIVDYDRGRVDEVNKFGTCLMAVITYLIGFIIGAIAVPIINIIDLVIIFARMRERRADKRADKRAKKRAKLEREQRNSSQNNYAKPSGQVQPPQFPQQNTAYSQAPQQQPLGQQQDYARQTSFPQQQQNTAYTQQPPSFPQQQSFPGQPVPPAFPQPQQQPSFPQQQSFPEQPVPPAFPQPQQQPFGQQPAYARQSAPTQSSYNIPVNTATVAPPQPLQNDPRAEAWQKHKSFIVWLCEKVKSDIENSCIELLNALNDSHPILLSLSERPGEFAHWKNIADKIIRTHEDITAVYDAAGQNWRAVSQRDMWELHGKLAELAVFLNSTGTVPANTALSAVSPNAPAKKLNAKALAVTALATGISALFLLIFAIYLPKTLAAHVFMLFLVFAAGAAGIVCGAIALARGKRVAEKSKRDFAFALSGLIAGGVALLITAINIISILSRFLIMIP